MLSATHVNAAVAACLSPGERAWVVGGAVRDALLGCEVNDLDYAVGGDAERVARATADRLGGAFFTYSERFSTHRVALSGGVVDFSPLRGTGIDADLAARDFTVDAMAWPVEASWPFGEAAAECPAAALVDPLGGVADLRTRRLATCSPTAFADDPLRLVRLVRLARALGFTPASGVLSAARAAACGLAAVSGERVETELTALLGLPDAAAAVRDLDDVGALEVILPEVTTLKGVEQNPFHHHDVYDHTLEALERAPAIVEQLGGARFLGPPEACGLPGAAPLAPLGYVMLFHDLGKPVVKQSGEDGRILFWHHDSVGSDMAVAIADRLGLSRRFRAYLTILIVNHLRLGFLVREAPLTRRALARYRRAVEPYVFESIVVSLADRLATRGEKTSATSIARHFRLARRVWLEIPKESRPALLSGEEVMGLLGIGPGPPIGEALAALQDEADALEVTRKDEAVAFLRRWWEARQAAGAGDEEREPPGGGDLQESGGA